jgi:hypothetical protein
VIARSRAGRSIGPPVLALVVALLAGACGTTPATPTTSIPDAPRPEASTVAARAVAAHVVPAGATASVDDATWALVDRLMSPDYTTDTTAAMQTALARAGIAVVPDTSTDPATAAPEVPLSAAASPFELLDLQAHALAVGVWAGATWSGAELDSLIPVPASTGAPSTSQLLAAYVGSADTPGGRLSRAVMAGQDLHEPSTLRFPAVVLVLFVSDLATDGGRIAAPAPSPSAAAGPESLPLAAVAQPGTVNARQAVDIGLICAGPSGWVDAIVSRIEAALEAATPSNVVGVIIVGIFNWFVHVAATVVKSLIDGFTAPVRATIMGIAAIISGVAQEIMTVLPYAVGVRTSGGNVAAGTFRLSTAPERGSFTAQVTAGDLPEWPAVIAACAKAAGIALPQPNVKGVPLTWGPLTPAAPLLGPTDQAATNMTTDEHGQAAWPFLVDRDPGDASGDEQDQIDRLDVAVHRPELDDARAKLVSALFGGIWAPIRPFVVAAFKPILDDLQSRLNALLDERGFGNANLIFHAKAPPTPSPSAAGSGAVACAVTLPAGTYQGTLTADSTTIVPPGQIDLGENGGDNSHATGPLTVIVAPDGTLGGTFQLTMQQHEVFNGPGRGTTDRTVQELGASVSGTLCTLTLTFASETITACHATGYGTCGGVGTTVSLAGLVPPLPLGAPTSAGGGSITWSVSAENESDAGFGGLSAQVQSTTTAVIATR